MKRLNSLAGIVRTRALVALGPIVPVPLPVMVSVDPKPFIHMLFRPETAEPWMTAAESTIPDNWLRNHGFGGMEYFKVKVGVAPAGVDKRV